MAQRGTVRSVGSSHGTLVERVKREPDGLVTEVKYGDGADTTSSFMYDDLRRLHNQTTYRASFGPANTLTMQMLLQDEEFVYDKVGNPIEIRDWRHPLEAMVRHGRSVLALWALASVGGVVTLALWFAARLASTPGRGMGISSAS